MQATPRPRPDRRGLTLFVTLRLVFLLVVFPAMFLARPVLAETRIALVIGINAYQNAPPLSNPLNDARAIGDALRRLNFDVEELNDPDYRALTRGIRNFGVRAQKADTAVVYYAGHGMQVDGENYLIPADAKLERPRDLAYEALPLSLMLDEISQASRIGIILLDSCRNNPFIDRVARAMNVAGRAVATTPGMARVDVPRNSMVVMAAKAGQIAEDGQDHSPFASAVLAHFQIPGLELGLFFRSVRDAVLKATKNRQEPYVFSSLGADPFYFYPRPPNRPPVIGPIATLQVADTAGPTQLGIPAPTDPDLDPLSVRIIGLPRGGEVRVEGRKAASGEAFSVDHFMTGTFKPDGTLSGPVGSLDILIEDGRGGSVTGSLPITVLPPSQPKAVAMAPAPASSLAPPAPGVSMPQAGTARPGSGTAVASAPVAQAAPGPGVLGPFAARTAPDQSGRAPLVQSAPDALATTAYALSAQPPSSPTGSLPTRPELGSGNAIVSGVAPPSPDAPKPLAFAGSAFPGPSANRLSPDQAPRPSLSQLPPLQPAPTPFGLAEVRTLALAVPCALIDVQETPSASPPVRLVVSGPTLPGAAFDTFLRLIAAPRRPVSVATEPLDSSHCAALAVMADPVRHTRDRGSLRLTTPTNPVPIGGQFSIAAEPSGDGLLYVDLFAPDGSVQHLQRGYVKGNGAGGEVTLGAFASGPPGQRLMTAIVSAVPLDLAERPANESAVWYLPALQHELARLTAESTKLRAEVATFSFIAAARPVAVSSRPMPSPPSPSRPQAVSNPRCQDIVSRVILGESLSDADRTLLRTSCGR